MRKLFALCLLALMTACGSVNSENPQVNENNPSPITEVGVQITTNDTVFIGNARSGSCTRTDGNTPWWRNYGYTCSFPSGRVYFGNFEFRAIGTSNIRLAGADLLWIKWRADPCVPGLACGLFPTGERLATYVQFGEVTTAANPWPGDYVTLNVRPWSNGTISFTLNPR